MGLRKHNTLDDNSQHKLQRKVSPIKSSSGLLLVTPKKKTVIKSTAATTATTIKNKKESWYKNRQHRFHRSGQVWRSSRLQRQAIMFLAVLFYHADNHQDFSFLLPSRGSDPRNHTTTTSSGSPTTIRHHQQQQYGIGMTLNAVRTHSLYSWIPKGTKAKNTTTTRPVKTNNRTSPLWKETVQVAQGTSLAIVQQSQKVWNHVGSVSMNIFSFRWVVPPRWKPQPPLENHQKLWSTSSTSSQPSSSLSTAAMEKSSLKLLPSTPQHYLRAHSPSLSPPPKASLSTAHVPLNLDDREELATSSSTTTTPTSTNIPNPSQHLASSLGRLWQQATTTGPAQLLQSVVASSSSSSGSTISSFPLAVVVGVGASNADKNKFRHWVEKIYAASVTTHHYDSHYRHGNGGGNHGNTQNESSI